MSSTPEPPSSDGLQGRDHAAHLERRIGRQSQWLALFFGFATALALSIVFLGDVLGSVADEISTVTVGIAVAVVVSGLMLMVVYATRDRLFRYLRLPVPGTLGDVLLKLRGGLEAWTEDPPTAIDRMHEGASSLAAWLAWARLRAWMLATVIGAASIFVLLVGEVLLLRQNQLIEEQNAYLRAQNESIRAQFGLEATQSYQARRAGLLATLYDRSACATAPCAHVGSLRARVDAARAFTEIELARTADGMGTTAADLCATGTAAHRPLDLRHLDLGPRASGRGDRAPMMEAVLPDWRACGVDLAHADLRRSDLRRSDLRRANLRDAELTGADLSSADLRRATLVGARLADAGLRGARLAGAALDQAWLRGADLSPAGTGPPAEATDLTGATLRRATLTGADLRRARLVDADLSGSDLSDADLSGADLTGARFEGSVRRDVKWAGATCPDGALALATCEGHLTPTR